MKGTVRKPRTPGGTWSYRIDLDVRADGRRRQKQVAGFPTRRAAQAALNDALASIQHGSYAEPSRETVAEFFDNWLTGVRTELAATAWTNYEAVVRRYIVPHLGSRRLAELSAPQIKRWQGELLAHGRVGGGPLSPRSVQLAHRILHRALSDAVRWHVLPMNPATAVRAPRAERREMSVWSAADAARFLKAVRNDRLGPLWTLALHTGLRRGELGGLRWQDIDLDRGLLTVAQQRTTAAYKVVVSSPKARSHRQLLLAPATMASLRQHERTQRDERHLAASAWQDSGYVFVDEWGRPYHPQRLRVLFERACKSTGLTSIRLHDLRHTTATLALQAGVHPKVVQEQLGHSVIDVTLNTYSHVPQAVRSDAADRIAGLLSGEG